MARPLLCLSLALASTAHAGTFVGTVGGEGLDWASDLAVAPDGDLILVGAVHADTPLPAADLNLLIADEPGDHRGFVVRLSPDGRRIRWLSLFPAETFVPSVVAVDEEVIVLGGDPLSRMASLLPPLHSDYGRAAVVVLDAQGQTVLGARGGPPNVPRGLRTRDEEHIGYQAGLTGIALHDGAVYVTGSTSGTGQAGYLMRYDTQTLEVVEFVDRPDPGRLWTIDLHRSAPDLWEGLFWRYDHTDPDAEFHQGDCRVDLKGNRRGGQVVVSDFDGGTIFGSFDLQYDFNCTDRWFPAFDAVIAAWDLDGNLKWVTNGLERLISEPDQGPRAMVFDPVRQRLIVALWQHGSNVSRLPGTLVGDTGNISIGWVGSLDPRTGEVERAWYQHAVRQGSNGEWNDDGTVARWPQNSGNTIHDLALDAQGRVLVLATGGNRMFTTSDALMDWPEDLWGGHTTLTVLSPELDEVVYATTLRAPRLDSPGSAPAALALNRHGVFLFGRAAAADFLSVGADLAPWTGGVGGRGALYLARISPEDLPFEPESVEEPQPGDDPDPGGDPEVGEPLEDALEASEGGCGCVSAGSSALWVSLLLVGLVRRRR
ncbi:MAG: hypothetical protein EA397_01325 [Deltaproteobacteria bacterium]|nr:MAG: hypothetical protein EA397_01325 [Deltaproteobacteria bacterium]